MALNVIDISSYQGDLNLSSLARYDGVVIKATEGTGYVNPDCDKHYQEAKEQAKKRAVYHFYDFGLDPVAQANYFVDNCRGYIHDAIFVLDWEGEGVADVGQALAFLKQVEARIGYKPAIYMSQYVENNYDWSPVVNNNNGLWIARYSNWELVNHAHDWDMSQAGQAPILKHWPFYFMWQWTSMGLLSGYAGNLDCDIAYLTPDQWDKYAGYQAPAPTTTTTTTSTTSTTSTTTAAPEPPAPTTTEAPATTTVAPNPVNPQPAETTQAPETGTPSVTVGTTDRSLTWEDKFWDFVEKFIKRLQGKLK